MSSSEKIQHEPSVTAIIVNYKSAPFTRRCIAALRKQTGITLDIVVVDNDSGPEDVASLTEIQNIQIIRNDTNLGFSKANNLGAQKAQSEFLLIINPDSEFEGTQNLVELCNWLKNHPQCGLVGPQIIEPGKHRPTSPKRHYPEEKRLRFTRSIATLPGEIAWLLGACLLMRKTLFNAIGGFDPDYFLYGEDTDLCLRIRQAGFTIDYCQNAHVTHVGGASAASLPSFEKYLRKKRGFLLFCQKHYDQKDFLGIVNAMRKSAGLKIWATTVKRMLRFISNQESTNRIAKWRAEYQAASEALERLASIPEKPEKNG
jgi:GT2 family glycosyltransferase